MALLVHVRGRRDAERDLAGLVIAQEQRLFLVRCHFEHALEREDLTPLGQRQLEKVRGRAGHGVGPDHRVRQHLARLD